MSQSSQLSQPPRRLRLALAVTLSLVLLPPPAVHAVDIPPTALRLPRLAEILSPLVDLVSHFWEKAGGGLDPSGAPQGEEGSGLDPDGAPAAAGSEEGSGLDPNGAH
jgi:hypothetical protein